MRQIFKNGEVVELIAQEISGIIRIPADAPINDIQAAPFAHDVVMLEFASSADGRGFSLAKMLKRTLPPTTQMVATGAIIPDLLTLAWQCGFDSAIISEELWQRCGPDSWLV